MAKSIKLKDENYKNIKKESDSVNYENFTTIELIELVKDVKDEKLVEDIYSEIAWRVLDCDYKPNLKLDKKEGNTSFFNEEKPKIKTLERHKSNAKH